MALELKTEGRSSTAKGRERPKAKRGTIPYLHAPSHSLKKLAARYSVMTKMMAASWCMTQSKKSSAGVCCHPHQDHLEGHRHQGLLGPAVFMRMAAVPGGIFLTLWRAGCVFNSYKVANLFIKINVPIMKGDVCQRKPRTRHLECVTGVLCDIPLCYGRSYIGQTGRCVNYRAREQAAAVKQSQSRPLTVHCNTCECSPMFSDMKVLARYINKVTREITLRGDDERVDEPSSA